MPKSPIHGIRASKATRQESIKSSGICRWNGCNDPVFRDGLCWDHYQHELGED